MRKIIALGFFLLFTLAFKPGEESVFVCDSEASVAYHKTQECRGLQKCKHTVITVSVKEAKTTYKKRACKICYK